MKKVKEGIYRLPLTVYRLFCYYLALTLVKLVSYIPFRVLYTLSDILFFPFYYLIRYRREIVRKNLTESFPEKNQHEINQIERSFYHFFIDMILESCKLMSISPTTIKNHMRFVNMEIVNNILREGKFISAFIGHIGNWEWISSSGLWVCNDATIAQIYHRLQNKTIDKIMRKLRERMGNVCIEMSNTVRYITHVTKDSKPHVFGLIADQSPKRNASKHFIKFLNHKVPVLTGPEKITKHFGFEAVYLSVKKIKRGYYECVISTLYDDSASIPDYELTNLYYQKLEQDILLQPEIYLWTHKRFRYAHVVP